jgi:hypothetical protein
MPRAEAKSGSAAGTGVTVVVTAEAVKLPWVTKPADKIATVPVHVVGASSQSIAPESRMYRGIVEAGPKLSTVAEMLDPDGSVAES